VSSVTYAVWVRGFTSMSPGPRPTATEGAAAAGQPAAVWPLQPALSIIETEPSSKLATYTVWLRWSAKIPSGVDPTATLTGVCPQPELTRALQLDPSITATELSSRVVTYTVCVARSTAIAPGGSPTVIVGHGPAHRVRTRALQRRASITDTVFPPALGPSGLLPLTT
jgi:hypothetical protein